jgi:hypothetical protein
LQSLRYFFTKSLHKKLLITWELEIPNVEPLEGVFGMYFSIGGGIELEDEVPQPELIPEIESPNIEGALTDAVTVNFWERIGAGADAGVR